MLEKYKIAVDKATEVLAGIEYDGNGMVNTSAVKQVVEKLYNVSIKVGEVSFSSLKNGTQDYGAMMKVENKTTKNESKNAFIVLNSDKDAIFKRFSFVHELGHIATEKYNFHLSNDNYTISTHIEYDINSLPDESCNGDYAINEEIANIFALMVLMPEKVFIEKILKLDSVKETAAFFGITTNAVLSRIRLGD